MHVWGCGSFHVRFAQDFSRLGRRLDRLIYVSCTDEGLDDRFRANFIRVSPFEGTGMLLMVLICICIYICSGARSCCLNVYLALSLCVQATTSAVGGMAYS